jgi:hypothetical protein
VRPNPSPTTLPYRRYIAAFLPCPCAHEAGNIYYFSRLTCRVFFRQPPMHRPEHHDQARSTHREQRLGQQPSVCDAQRRAPTAPAWAPRSITCDKNYLGQSPGRPDQVTVWSRGYRPGRHEQAPCPVFLRAQNFIPKSIKGFYIRVKKSYNLPSKKMPAIPFSLVFCPLLVSSSLI